MFENLQIEDNLPDIRDIKYQAIEKSYLTLLLIKAFLIFGILITAAIIFVIPKMSKEFQEFIYLVYLIPSLLFGLILTLFILGFSKRKYAIRQKDISFRHGVLVHSIITIPFSRIQHIEIDEGMFERLFKLASLNIYTAGDNGKDLKISGLTKEKSLQLKEIISNYLTDESE